VVAPAQPLRRARRRRRRRHHATAKALSNGTSFGQVGSNFAENVTPEIVKLTLGYADKIQENAGPCWSRGTADWDNNEKRGLWRWQLSDGSKNVLLNAGTIPTTHRIC